MTNAAELAPPVDEALLETVSGAMDLRAPNRDAVEVLAIRLHQWYSRPRDTFFEGVIDTATGVGKTFVIAAALDYFAAMGVRNFAVIVPGATILNKTVAQFSQGPKSLLGLLNARPKVITSENFRTSEVANALADDRQVKLYAFTVQALIKPTSSKVGRRTHAFQEGLGGAFYEHLDGLDDLLVFADEHHSYFGPSFGAAIRDLTPWGLVGLTGTPHRKTPPEDIIFRYPLAAAIADGFVKTPVLVGRKDDRTDERTQLLDGAALLEAKERAIGHYCARTGAPLVQPIMLVNCKDIGHAQETVAYLQSEQFCEGRYSADGAVLEVHSSQSEQALAALDRVEEPSSPCRIIVQVGMLKEGWDVKNVYVIASLRASISDILTEQTLGRGLRLPFGKRTDVPLLNELDVIAHERYADLLARTGTLRESFIDKRTVIERFINAEGEEETAVRETTVEAPLVESGEQQWTAVPVVIEADGVTGQATATGTTSPGVIVNTTEDRIAAAQQTAQLQLMPMRDGVPVISVPVVRTQAVPQAFSLAQVVDLDAFRTIGRRLAVAPDEDLKRTALGAVVKQTLDGRREAQIDTSEALQRVEAAIPVEDPAEARQAVLQGVMADRLIPARRGEPHQVVRLLDAILQGAGDKADTVLIRYRRALVRQMIAAIRRAKDELPLETQTTEVVMTQPFAPQRMARESPSLDRKGTYERGRSYAGWSRNLFPQAWFDSSTERDAANLLDDADDIAVWVRLQRNDLPILWDGADRTYNPDLLAVGTDNHHWIVETKSDRDMPSDAVQNKRAAALAWANTVTAQTDTPWSYLLVSERDLREASGSWARLRQATGA